MKIDQEVNKLKEDINFKKDPTYEKLIKLKLRISKFYLKSNFDIEELENRKKYLSKDFIDTTLNLANSFVVGIASGLYLNIFNFKDKFMIIFSLFIAITLVILTYKLSFKNINRYFDDIADFEMNIIDKLLKESYKEKFLNDIKIKKEFLSRYKWCLEKIEDYKNKFYNEDILKKYWKSKIRELELEIKILEEELI